MGQGATALFLSSAVGRPDLSQKHPVSRGNGLEGVAGDLGSRPEQRRLRACLPFSSLPPLALCAPALRDQRLQRQVARLHEAFRSQESRWAAAQRQLQSQMDALTRQNLQLWVGLKASGPPRPGAGEAVAAALGTRRKAGTLVWKAFLFYVQVASQ